MLFLTIIAEHEIFCYKRYKNLMKPLYNLKKRVYNHFLYQIDISQFNGDTLAKYIANELENNWRQILSEISIRIE